LLAQLQVPRSAGKALGRAFAEICGRGLKFDEIELRWRGIDSSPLPSQVGLARLAPITIRNQGEPRLRGERSDCIARCNPGEGFRALVRPVPLTRIASQFDLSPLGRGKRSPWTDRFNLTRLYCYFVVSTPACLITFAHFSVSEAI
jgi:hypothetical protein